MKKIITRKRCPECGKGELIYKLFQCEGIFSNSNGTYYPHYCNKCSYKTALTNDWYPKEHFEFEEHEVKEVWE